MTPANQELGPLDRILIIGITISILLLAVLRFAGIPDQYAILFEYSRNSSQFPNDLYLNNTFFFDASYYFTINALLGLDQNEIISFTLYLAITAITAYFAFQLLSRHFGLKKPIEILFIILLMCFLDRNFPLSPWTGIIPTAPGIPAMFAWSLGIAAIYCMLEKRIWLSSALITFVISLHIVGDFILFPILFFFVILSKEISYKKIAALILPVVYLSIKYITASITLPSGANAEPLYELVKEMAGLDTYILDHPTIVIVFFAASMLIFPVFIWRISLTDAANPNLLAFFKALWLASFLVILFFIFYTTFGYRYFYYPPLIMLFPARAMNYYALFFYLISYVLILQTTKLTSIEKISMILALVLFHLKSIGGILYPGLILFGGILVSRITGQKLQLLKSTRFLIPIGFFAIVALTGAQLLKGGKYFHSFNVLGWEHLNRWTQTIDADESVWNTYKKIRDITSDFAMLPFYRSLDGKLVGHNSYLNIFAQKSRFIADSPYHFIFNEELLKEHMLRAKAYDEIYESTKNHHPLSEWARNILRSRNVTIVVPIRDSVGLLGWTEKTVIGNFYMLNYAG